MHLFLLVLLPIGTGVFIYLTKIQSFKALVLWVQSILLLASAYLFVHIDLLKDAPVRLSLGQVPSSYGIHLYADEISAFLVVLTTFLFLLLMVYGLENPSMTHHFLFLFLLLEGMIIGIFLAQDLFTLYVLIEVSTLTVAILLMYGKQASTFYDGVVYLFTNIVTMAFYLVGIGYVYKTFGTLDFLQLQEMIPRVTDARSLILPYAFLFTGIGLKLAILPLFDWLPRAHVSHSAPYIVSAVLSALYIKANLYAFIRLQSVFNSQIDTGFLFLVLGIITSLTAAVLAMNQKDIQLILAYSTISQIGLILISLSVGTDFSYYGAIYHIFNHALFKSALFLIVGLLVDHYGTHQIHEIRGVFHYSPALSIAMVMALLGVTGAPLFNGSISKYLIQEGFSSHSQLDYIIIALNIGTILYAIKLFQVLPGNPITRTAISIKKKTAILMLAFLCLVFGVFGQVLVEGFFSIQLQWTFMDYVEKTLIYLFSVLVALCIYYIAHRPNSWIQQLRGIELTFNELMLSIVLFFSGLLGYLIWTV